MSVDPVTARAMVEAAHAAWSNGDLEGVLAWYTEDATYMSNVGPTPDGEPYMITGKQAMRGFLGAVLQVAESMSVVEHFVFENGVGRARVACYIRDKATGLVLSGTYRQKHTFRDGRIATLEEIHDAARMAAFWRLVGSHVTAGNPLATLD